MTFWEGALSWQHILPQTISVAACFGPSSDGPGLDPGVPSAPSVARERRTWACWTYWDLHGGACECARGHVPGDMC